MTYEKVLEVFKDYLNKDADCEVVNTSRGYMVVYWESYIDTWVTTRLAQTPEELRDILRTQYENFLGFEISQIRKREPDVVEQEEIRCKGAELADRC